MMKLTEEEIMLLNSRIGLHALLKNRKIDIPKILEVVKYSIELKARQEELIKLQHWVIRENKKVVVLFEGRDAAGKGGAIKRITEYINPRHYKIVALNIPTSDEKMQWFFQRYINELAKPGQLVFFDRSWYNRAIVEPVNGFCTEEEYEIFMSQVNGFEKMLIQSDTYLIKLYFSITKKEQAKRLKKIRKSPLKRWKMSAVDEKALGFWNEYTHYKKKMFELTNTECAPWEIIDANNERIARLRAIEHILERIPYSELPDAVSSEDAKISK